MYKQKRMPFIQQLLDMQDPLNWLQVGDTALNEFRTEALQVRSTKLFPTLLSFEKGNPSSSIQYHPVIP